MKTGAHVINAKLFDGLVENDLVTLDGDAIFGQSVCDVACCNRTIKLTGVTSLTKHGNGLAFDRGGNAFSFFLSFKVAGFDICTL